MRRDPLTKLLNKLEIQRETDAFLEGAEDGTHVLFLIDIDNFKVSMIISGIHSVIP